MESHEPDWGRSPDSTFADRRHAGRELASRLGHCANERGLVVLALPRGGVPVAFEVAQALDAPLDVFVVRKLGAPMQPELAMGAIASGGVRVLNDEVVGELGIPEAAVEAATRRELIELGRREAEYRQGRPPLDLAGRVAILVDDGLATGSTMRAAAQAVRARGARRVVVAVPVGAPGTCAELAEIADDVVCARTPESFSAVGQWYEDFTQTTDGEVRDLLEEHERRARTRGGKSLNPEP